MGTGWYYAHEEDERKGPYSGEQLKEFAADGTILPTDTVWKGGVEDGVTANLIKNLFAAAPPVVESPEAKPVVKPEAPKRAGPPEGKGAATAVKGADIVSQDGQQARYRMKCVDCGTKDSSCRTIRLANKTLTTNYFCPKCKKKKEVVIRCRG